MSDIELRPARAADFSQVFALFGQLWPGRELNRTAQEQVFTAALASSSDALLCATENGQVCGFCALVFHHSFWQEGQAALLTLLIVDEKKRGRKIGSALLQEADRVARGRGCRYLELESATHRIEAHRFYLQHGFTQRALYFSRPL